MIISLSRPQAINYPTLQLKEPLLFKKIKRTTSKIIKNSFVYQLLIAPID